MKKTILLFIFGLISVYTQMQAKSYYIRISTNTSDWSNITPDNVNSFIVDYIAGTNFATTFNAYLASDSVWMAKGTYTIGAAIAPKTGMIVRGGFAGNENSLANRATSDLDANGVIEPWEFTNITEIVPAASGIGYYALNFNNANIIVDGVTVKNFAITSTVSQVVKLFATATGSFFKNSIVKDNSLTLGIASTGAVTALIGTVQNCLIQSNIISVSVSPSVSSQGGGIQLSSNAVASGCVIRGNKVTNSDGAKCKGAGAFIQTGAKLINCALYNNETVGASSAGGGVYINDATSEVINCTVAKNKAAGTGGGVFFNNAGKFNNSIAWSNISAASTNSDIHYGGTNNGTTYTTDYLAFGEKVKASGVSAYPTLANTKTLTSGASASNTTDGSGTFAPKFLNPTTAVGVPTDGTTTTAMTKANFKLGDTSPCIDYASKTLLDNLSITNDLMNVNRYVVNNTPDLGAYEGQFISGAINISSLTDCPTCDLNVKNSGHLTIDASKTLAKVTVEAGAKLSVATGQTLTLTNLTLKSDAANGTSTFVPVGTGALTVTGTTAVEQYLATTRNWYVSSPVSNAVAPAGYTYYGRYEPGGTETGWTAVSVGAGLTAGKGYIALPGTTGLPITFTTQSGGTLNNGTITIPLTYTSAATSSKGFNLIGNPYPSHLSWTSTFVTANAAKIEASIWYRTNSGSSNTGGWSFVTYNPITGESVPTVANGGIIPPMQAFWVLAKNVENNSIQFTNTMRSHETGNPLKAPIAKNVDRKKVRLQLSNGTRTDETLLVFDANALDGYDGYDSPKMMNNATDIADIYTVIDAKDLVINGMNSVKYDTEIPVGFSTVTANNFSISANEISNFENGTRVILIDKEYPEVENELTVGTAYNFSAPITAATTDRFSLIFRAPGTTTGVNNTIKPNVQVFVNKANKITIIAPEKSNYAIYNAMGQIIEKGIATSNYQTSNLKLSQGVYVVKVGNYNSTRVIIK